MIAVDLFCGAGGLTRGFLDAGIQVVLGVDANGDCRETFQTNNPPASFLCADIREVTGDHIRRFFPVRYKGPLLLAGCAPCQPFSSHRRGTTRSDESTLLLEFARLAEELQPDWIFLENVPGLAKIPGFSTFRRFQKTLVDLDYGMVAGVIDAKTYGVPQTRRRFVVIGTKKGTPSFPESTHGPGRCPFQTVRDTISHFPKIRAGENHPLVPNHRAASLTSLNLIRLRKTPKNGGRWLDWSEDLLLPCHRDNV